MQYRAFLSYSRADDRVANWLHGQLDNYRTPKSLVGSEGAFGDVPAKLHPIFRDRTDMSGGGQLSDRIERALADSETLLVLCSPAAAASPWVNREVEVFTRLRPSAQVFPIIAWGLPDTDDVERDYFPPALRGRGVLAADLREIRLATGKVVGDGRDGGRLKLIAGVLGVGLDNLAQRERRRQRLLLSGLSVAATAFAGVAIAAVWFGVAALNNSRALDRSLNISQGVLDAATGVLTSEQYADVAALEPLQSDMLDQLLPFYQRLLAEKSGDHAATVRYARSLISLARLKSNYESMAAAEHEFRSAYGALWELRETPNLPAEYRNALASAALGLASQLAEIGDRTAAQTIIDQTTPLVEASPDWQLARACALLAGDPTHHPLENSRDLAREVSEYALRAADSPPATNTLEQNQIASCIAAAALTLGEPGQSQNPNAGGLSGRLFEQAEGTLRGSIDRRPTSLDAHSRLTRLQYMRAQWEIGRSTGDTQALDFADIFLDRASREVAQAHRTVSAFSAFAPASRRVAADRAAATAVEFEIALSQGRAADSLTALNRWLEESAALVRLDPASQAIRGRITDRIIIFSRLIAGTHVSEYALPACRSIRAGVARLEAINNETTEYPRAAIATLSCILELHRPGFGSETIDPGDRAILNEGRNLWQAYFDSAENAWGRYGAVRERLAYLRDFLLVSPNEVTPEEALTTIQSMINREFPRAIGLRHQFAELIARDTIILHIAGRTNDARDRYRRCGGDPVGDAVCASALRTLASQVGEHAPPATFMDELTRGAIKGEPRFALLFTEYPQNPQRPFGTLFNFGSVFSNVPSAIPNLVILDTPIGNERVFADVELEHALRNAGETSGSEPVWTFPRARFLREALARRMDVAKALALTTDPVLAAAAFGRQSNSVAGNANLLAASTAEANAAVAWLRARRAENTLSPYLALYREVVGSDWFNSDDARGMDRELLTERGVIVLQGSNVYGRPISTYLSLTLESLIRLRDKLRRQEDFLPRDYGTVIYAGAGDPPLNVRLRLGLFHNMITASESSPQQAATPDRGVDARQRGSAASDRGDYAVAIAAYDEALALDRNDVSALNGRCWARALSSENLDAAMADCNRAIEILPQAGAIYDSRAMVHFRRGDFSAALADLEHALSADPTLTESLYLRGIVRLRLGQADAGRDDIAAAAARDPEVAETYRRYGITP